MLSWCGIVSRLKDACHSCIMFEIIHIFINVHHCLIVVIRHSHQRNVCQNSLEMSWNTFQLTNPSPLPLATDVTRWVVNGANVEIPSTCAYMHRNLTLLDKRHAFTVWEGFKSQGMSSNKPITDAIIHWHRTLSSGRGERWNSFAFHICVLN